MDRIVLSASRRTDIPAFYMDWFMECTSRGVFTVVNPYNRKERRVPAAPDRVHTIVFWSKNFGPFIEGAYADCLEKRGYRLFFNFTVNSDVKTLEPDVPALEDRLVQLRYLCRRFDPRAVTWRFDPVCFYRGPDGEMHDNLKDFERIARVAAASGIRRCTTSFVDHYAKVRRRVRKLGGLSLADPSPWEKRACILRMERTLSDLGIRLYTCCEKGLLEHLPAQTRIGQGACIDNRRIMEIYGGRLSLARDTGQRVRQGCGCSVSVDVGSYDLHPCYHNCLFCYANPVSKTKTRSTDTKAE